MALEKNNTAGKLTTTSNKVPRDRFVIGKSESYFESPEYLAGKMTPEIVTSLLHNENTQLMVSKGQSLKVMFAAPTGELKFVGFITAGDGSVTMTEEDIPIVQAHIESGEPIIRAITADELIALF